MKDPARDSGLNKDKDTSANNYDYHLEVANTGFGDMLHDKERNIKYYEALKEAIAHMHAEGQTVHVLDIGTGTGILSMMALKCGADSVTACEAFLPMAECAERILEANGVRDKINLIRKRSTELRVGDDMPRKANLLVAELLDTELIGEGAIAIYNHAHKYLLTDDVTCIPTRATCYAQIAQTPLASQWNSLKIVANLDGDVLLCPPKEVLDCGGGANLHDIQLSQLDIEKFIPITEPVEIFDFDFNSKDRILASRNRTLHLKSKCGGSTDLVFFWWSIKMNKTSNIMLSCAPFWAHPELKELKSQKPSDIPLANCVPWRDHWMQAVYYIRKPIQLPAAGSEFVLSCYHDEYSYWFDIASVNNVVTSVSRHCCTCSFHFTYARSRIGQINELKRSKTYLRYLEDAIQSNSKVLTLGDSCLLGLSTAKMGATQVLCYEPNQFSRSFMTKLAKHNLLQNVKFVASLESLENATLAQLTHIFAEPYFLNAILPWDNFYFGALLLKIFDGLSPSVNISPRSAEILAVPVEFLDLHKIQTPVGSCEGFSLSLFDEMVALSSTSAHSKVEAQPLWEYPCRALAQPQEFLFVDFTSFSAKQQRSGVLKTEVDGTMNGIALWVNWHINEKKDARSVVSTGPVEPIETGCFIKWNMFVRQGVHLMGNNVEKAVKWTVNHTLNENKVQFDFKAFA